MAEGGERTSQGSTDEKGANVWSLLPAFDPSVDSTKEYADKVRFLWGICPSKDWPLLAPRLALLCKGTAWSQVKDLDSTKLTDGETGYKTLLGGLLVEDKKEVIAMSGGYEPDKIEGAMRSLSTKVLGQGDAARKRVYPVNYVDDEMEETYYMGEEEADEDTILAALKKAMNTP